MDDSNDIIAGCLNGNRRDQELLYRRNVGKMYALCLRYSNDKDEASDLLQEGFIRIFNRLRDYKREGSFEGWMRKIMVNTALEKYRENHFLYNVDSIDDINETDIAEVDADGGLEANDLMGMIKSLPPQYKMVFNLYAIEGYSHKEIGQMLGITVGTSKSNLSRARSILQRMVRLSTNTKVSGLKEKSDWKKRTY